MTNKDLQLLEEIVNTDIPNLIPKFMNEAFNNGTREIEHPLDCTVTEKLKEISSKMRDEDDDYRIFCFADDIKDIWKLVIQNQLNAYVILIRGNHILNILQSILLRME